MAARGEQPGSPPEGGWKSLVRLSWPVAVVLVLAVAALPVLQKVAPADQGGMVLLVVGAGIALILLGLRNPVLAVFYLMFTTLFRLALPHVTPVDPWLLAFGGVILAVAIWGAKADHRIEPLGLIEAMIGLYILWNLISMVFPHEYPAGGPFDAVNFPVGRFILIGTVMPLSMYVVGRNIFSTEKALRALLWAIVAAGGYSAAVSIMQFTGPKSLVWPRFIITDPGWPDRAVGAFNQPVVNGLVLIYGFIAALVLASYSGRGRGARAMLVLVAAGCAYGVYLTHTRAVWLALVGVLIGGLFWAKGFRRGFAITAVVVAVGALANWSVLTGSDRAAGGVGSLNEVHDRMNTLATSIWAAEQKPIFGWGIGRFPFVNTYHHKQWSPETPWVRGFGIASHFNEMGILAELGLIGLALWLSILVLIAVRLVRNFRQATWPGLCGRPLALMALMVFGVQVAAGFTVDLRYFDFPSIVSFLLVGATLGYAEKRSRAAAEQTQSERERSGRQAAADGSRIGRHRLGASHD